MESYLLHRAKGEECRTRNIKVTLSWSSRRYSYFDITILYQGEAEKLTLIQTYKRKIETELEDICSDILEIIKVSDYVHFSP